MCIVWGVHVYVVEDDPSKMFNIVGLVGGVFGTLRAEGQVASLTEETLFVG